MKNQLLTLIYVLTAAPLLLGQSTSQDFIYFDSDLHNLDNEDYTTLKGVFDKINTNMDFEMEIIGHTDQDGDDNYNYALARKRAENVKDYFVSKGAQEQQISISWAGEKQLADNAYTNAAKQKNRRVEISTWYYNYEDVEDILTSAHTVPVQYYNTNTKIEETIDCNAGSTLIIPPNAFTFEDGSPLEGAEVTIDVKEAFTYSDFISEELFTHSKGDILESGGMISVNATANGKPVKLAEGKSIEIIYPLQNTKDGMELFYATEDAEGNLDWSPNDQSIGTTNLKKYGDAMDDETIKTILELDFSDLEKPKLSFEPMPSKPRISRFPHPPAKPDYGFPSDFEKYELKYKNYEEALANYHTNKPLQEEKLVSWNNEVNSRLNAVWNHKRDLKNYHAKMQSMVGLKKIKTYIDKRSTREILAMIEANFTRGLVLTVNDAKLYKKAFGNYTREITGERKISLQQTDYSEFQIQNILGGIVKKMMNDAKNKKIELQYAESGEVDNLAFSSYVTSVKKLGWINCDRFINFANRRNLLVKNVDANSKYFLIFDDIKSMISPRINNGTAIFKAIPQGQNVRILGVKLVDNKPYVAVKKHQVQKQNILEMDFQPGSLAMIKEQLSQLEVE